MRRRLAIAAGAAAVVAIGFGTSRVVSDDPQDAGAEAASPSAAAAGVQVGTATFTNEYTYTLPPPETVTVTVTTEPPPPTTAPPPATTAPPPTTEPPPPTTTAEPPAPVQLANLWVDPDSGTCVRTAQPSSYSTATACTWKGAYLKAVSGDTIMVKGGTYGTVTVGPNRPAVTAVTYRTAPGEQVVLDGIENGRISGDTGASNVTFLGPGRTRQFRNDKVSNVVVDGWTVDCDGCIGLQIFHVEAADNVTVRNSEIADNLDNSLIWISGSNLTFDHNEIHHAGLRPGSGAHTECMYAWQVTNLRLTRNHFYGCAVFDVFITGAAVADGGFVENNIFESPTGEAATAFKFRDGGNPSPDPRNWAFRYNTWLPEAGLLVGGESPVVAGSYFRVVGNDFQGSPTCSKAGGTFSHNRGCAGVTTTLDAGDPADFPPTDRDGRSRPAGAGPDIGAFERG